MSDTPTQQDEGQGLTWLQRVLRRLRRTTHGDVVAASIGGGSSGVAVGKNIIQIGTLTIPVWLLAVVVAGIVLIAAASAYPFVKVWLPQRMGDGQFNIAVAEFRGVDGSGQPVSNDDVQELSLNIANFLAHQEDVLTNEVMGQQVRIWGPDKGISPVKPGEEAKRAADLNAHTLLYGTLQIDSDNHWIVHPKFFLTDAVVGDASELRGEHGLGAGISYRPFNVASQNYVNTELRQRLSTLSKMLVGLSYMAFGDPLGYERARAAFRQVIDEPEEAEATPGGGKELAYLFLGNAYLGEAFLTADESPQRVELLIQARDAFSTAVRLDPSYARAFNGLGSTLFQLSRPPANQPDCDWNWTTLEQTAHQYTTAMDLPASAKPALGQVDYRASFGLGRVHFWRGLCSADEAQWEQARTYYQSVLTEYDALTTPIAHLTDIAGYAHTDIGTMALMTADRFLRDATPKSTEQPDALLAESIEHYATAIALNTQSGTADGAKHAVEVMPYYLTALCLDEQGKVAQEALQQFVADLGDGEAKHSYIVERTPIWEKCAQSQ